MYNSDLPAAEKATTLCEWAVYYFSNSYLASSIVAHNLPFHVTLTADPSAEGQALFEEFAECKSIFNGIKELY